MKDEFKGDMIAIFNIVKSSDITVPAEYRFYNLLPIGRYRKYCGIDTVFLKTTDSFNEIVLNYLGDDGSKKCICTKFSDDFLEIDTSWGELLSISS